MKHFSILVLALFVSNTLIAQSMEERTIDKAVIVDATPAEVYERWTTGEGVANFFCENNSVEPWVFGKFEMYFLPDAPDGHRVAGLCVILGVT